MQVNSTPKPAKTPAPYLEILSIRIDHNVSTRTERNRESVRNHNDSLPLNQERLNRTKSIERAKRLNRLNAIRKLEESKDKRIRIKVKKLEDVNNALSERAELSQNREELMQTCVRSNRSRQTIRNLLATVNGKNNIITELRRRNGQFRRFIANLERHVDNNHRTPYLVHERKGL